MGSPQRAAFALFGARCAGSCALIGCLDSLPTNFPTPGAGTSTLTIYEAGNYEARKITRLTGSTAWNVWAPGWYEEEQR